MRKLLGVFAVLCALMLLGVTAVPSTPAPASAPASAPAVLPVAPIAAAAAAGAGVAAAAAATAPAPVAAPAIPTLPLPDVPVADPDVPNYDVGKLLGQLGAAVKAGDWMAVVAIAIALLVFGMKLLWPFWKQKEGLKPYLPWLALAMALGVVLSSGLLAHLTLPNLIATLLAALGIGWSAIGAQDSLKKFKESKLWAWIAGKLGITTVARAEKMAKDAAVVLSRAGKSLSLSPDGKVLLDGQPFGPK